MKIMRKLENIFSAVAFAEEGEHETARQILRENDQETAREHGTAEPKGSSKHEHAYHSPSKA